MGFLNYSKVKDNFLLFQVNNNFKSKEKQIVKENKTKSEIEDEVLKPTNEDSMKKVKKKGRTSKFYYCSKEFH